MITRRQVIKLFGVAGGAAFFPPLATEGIDFTFFNSSKLAKFIQPLALPAVLRPSGLLDGAPHYTVRMSEFHQNLHPDLPDTRVWGYNGSYPGPTIEARTNEPLSVEWINNLPSRHLLPIDHTVYGAYKPTPNVRTVVHLHGGRVSPESDGNPEAWYTSDGKRGPFFESTIFRYPNDQRAATLWFHDHALGITRLNVYAGLAGFYLLRDDVEDSLNLPSGRYEIPIVIQDRILNRKGQLVYPVSDIPNAPWVPEFFGNTIVVNGRIWPFLKVEPRKYRFRILNGSNARFYNLELSSGQSFFQIGNEGGLLPSVVELKKILLAPAERADVIVDFSEKRDQKIVLTSTATAPFPSGDVQTFDIMQFRVVRPLKAADPSEIPSVLPAVPRLHEDSARKIRTLRLQEIDDPEVPGRLLLRMNDHDYDSPTTEFPVFNTTEVWRLVNTTADTHPIHLHLVHFQVLDRQAVDVERYEATGHVHPIGARTKPDRNERGWKDTVRANPGEITRIIAHFDGFRGMYMWHCHILEHEDNEMMRAMIVV
jgi:spore coat protein A